MKRGCSIYFSSVLQFWYVDVRISRIISEKPLDFEITRVDCIIHKSIWAATYEKISQRRLKSVCTSTHSHQSLRCPHDETLYPWLFKMWPVKIPIRLCVCTGWSESSLDAHVQRYVFWRCDLYIEMSKRGHNHKTQRRFIQVLAFTKKLFMKSNTLLW